MPRDQVEDENSFFILDSYFRGNEILVRTSGSDIPEVIRDKKKEVINNIIISDSHFRGNDIRFEFQIVQSLIMNLGSLLH